MPPTRKLSPLISKGVIFEMDGYGILLAHGTTVPSDAAAGYAPGCIFIHRDGSADDCVYANHGSKASANFDKALRDGATVAALTVTALSVADITYPAAGDLIIAANTAAALEISNGTVKVMAFDTRSTVKDVSSVKITAVAPTIATEAAAHLNPSLQIAAKTVTYTGTASVTSSLGVGMHIGIPTFTDADAGTLSLASNLHVAAVASAGGSLTLTASRMISTSVTDCYLTNAGVWTDTSCWGDAKEAVSHAASTVKDRIESIMSQLTPAAWQYASEFERQGYDDNGNTCTLTFQANDFNRERVGIIYDELPGELRAPGEERGVSPGLLASFALAALKTLWDRVEALEHKKKK